MKARAEALGREAETRDRLKGELPVDKRTAEAKALPDAQLAAAETHVPYFVTDEVTDSSHWKKSIVINGLGAVATFVVLCVFITTKFIHGAWIVVVVIPLLVLMFRAIHKHYVGVAKQLSTEGLEELSRNQKHRNRAHFRHPPRRHQCAAVCQVDLAQWRQSCICGFRRRSDQESAREMGAVGIRCGIGGASFTISRTDASAAASH